MRPIPGLKSLSRGGDCRLRFDPSALKVLAKLLSRGRVDGDCYGVRLNPIAIDPMTGRLTH